MASWNPNLIEAKKAEMSQYGVDLIADTNTHAGYWWKIEVVTDTVFNALTSNWSAAPTGTVTAGTVMTGHFTSIDLTSGSIRAHRTGQQ